MIVRDNGYPQSVFFSSSNTVLASMYEISNSIVEYFYLRKANEGLAEENTRLKNRVTDLQNQLLSLQPEITDSTYLKIDPDRQISFISAKVINNSTNKVMNYITLNRGEKDGIEKDMGVINEYGVVGFISNVSENYSVVVPVLNPKTLINCKFKRNNYLGAIHWEDGDYRYANLNDIARHVQFSLGDTIITSGFTDAFPEGVLVGTVDDFSLSESDAYYNIKVKLAVDFRTLSYVKVIRNLHLKEQRNLEKSVTQ